MSQTKPNVEVVPTRLICIQHERCIETAATTYVLVPEDWSYPQVRDALARAKAIYLEAIELAKTEDPEPNPVYQEQEIYKKYPDLTVREVNEIIDRLRAERREWEERRRKTRRRFEGVLRDEGFLGLWENRSGIPTFRIDWGHLHGVPIDYSETERDTLPPPIKIVDPEWEDPDAW